MNRQRGRRAAMLSVTAIVLYCLRALMTSRRRLHHHHHHHRTVFDAHRVTQLFVHRGALGSMKPNCCLMAWGSCATATDAMAANARPLTKCFIC